MNKRITTLFLCLVTVAAMLVSAIPVFAETSAHPPVTFTIKADKTTATPGETITYQALIGPVEKLQTAEFKLVIPDELEYTGGSSPEGLAAKMNATTAEFTSSSMKFILGGINDYTSTSDTLLVTFTCKVKEGAAAGAKPVVKVKEGEEFFYFADSELEPKYYTINYDPNGAAVTIAAAPKPATGITLNKSVLTLTAGNSDTSLTANVTPSDSTDTVVWSTNKPEVATVNPATGKVTAVAPGDAIITAKAGTKTATCTVTVTCAHSSLRPVAEKASNCTEKGWDAYKKCDLCGKLFDMNGNLISEIPYRALNNDHDYNTSEWGYKGADGHAHTCSRNAEHHDAVQAHTPDHEGGATYDYAVKCSVCNYVIEPQLEAGNIRIEVPFKLTVKKTGEMDPGKETFKFVVERFGAPVEYVLVQDTVETEGEKTYDGKFVFTISANQAGNLSEGFVIRQVKGNAEGWTYDETKFYATPMFADTYTNVAGWRFLKYDENAELDYNNPIEEIVFTNSYNAKKPVTPPAPQKPESPKKPVTPPAPQKTESPKTGDSNMAGLWIALLFVSAASLTGTTLYSRKKRANNR